MSVDSKENESLLIHAVCIVVKYLISIMLSRCILDSYNVKKSAAISVHQDSDSGCVGVSVTKRVDKKCVAMLQNIAASPISWCYGSKFQNEMNTPANVINFDDACNTISIANSTGNLVQPMIRLWVGKGRERLDICKVCWNADGRRGKRHFSVLG